MSTAQQPVEGTPMPNLVKMKVDSENTAFNLLISFIGVAQRRGAFSLDEAAKIFECIQLFKRTNPPPSSAPSSAPSSTN